MCHMLVQSKNVVANPNCHVAGNTKLNPSVIAMAMPLEQWPSRHSYGCRCQCNPLCMDKEQVSLGYTIVKGTPSQQE